MSVVQGLSLSSSREELRDDLIYHTLITNNTTLTALSSSLLLFLGFYHEQVYHDPAQIFSSCQTLNVTKSSSTSGMSMDFTAKYGPVPFTIVEVYNTPDNKQNEGVKGVFNKRADIPGGDLLVLPSVIVDVVPSSSGDYYEGFSIYSCKNVVGQASIREFVVATREEIPGEGVVEGMVKVAREVGVDVDLDDLKVVKEC